jgi:carbon monoxide dehydrogenase subunit G
MDLNHSFTVPASVEETWRTFEDIESVAGCFPGAVVTEVDGPDFKGTCKVKLGPIAMVYAGTGTFREKDAAARRFVVDAKGKDKRGNGTAGAVVTATMVEESPGTTKVDVQTDLAITGKPAQFGRGVIEDISNKLLQQFVTCLQDKVGVAESDGGAGPGTAEAASGTSDAEPVGAAPPEVAVDGADSTPGPDDASVTGGTPIADGIAAPVSPAVTSVPSPADEGPPARPVPSSPAGAAGRRDPRPPADEADDALDLGATVLPILARTYGPRAGVALLLVLVGWVLGRRGR